MIGRRLCAAVLLVASLSLPADALSTGEPAALLAFPLISVDGASGTDTLIQITNTDAADVAVRCVYEKPSGTDATAAFTPFLIHLTADQPVAWRAGSGLAAVPGAGGAIPALPAFTGVLRCVAADTDGKPTDRNVLVGSATVERFVTAPGVAVDSARYNATGIGAVPGASNGDDQLVLGGPQAEYDACPASLILQSFLDGAVVDLGAGAALHRTLSTTLALVTCAQSATAVTKPMLDLSLTNEFGLLLTAASRPFGDQLVVPLSQLDNDDPSRSIFAVGMQGSLTATIHITPRPGTSGVLAVAFPTYVDPADAANRATAAVSPQLDGALTGPDVVDFAVPTARPTCAGDCNRDGKVTINELVTAVNIALGSQPLTMCPSLDTSGNGRAEINEVIAAVNHALNGC